MGHRTDDTAVLDDRGTGHEHVKDRTKFCTNLFSICNEFYIVFITNNASGQPEALEQVMNYFRTVCEVVRRSAHPEQE